MDRQIQGAGAASSYTPPVGVEQIAEATRILREYKAGKAQLEERIREDDIWWRMQQFRLYDRADFGREYPSAWLFNSIMGKHAAAMENYPEPNILPREQSDEQEAKTLSDIVPVVMESNDFKETYSQIQWRKMQSGTGCYGVFWEQSKLNGLGDVSILPINILNLFWEPGVRDIQQSRNLYNVELVDIEVLRDTYPDVDFGVSGDAISVREYAYEDYPDLNKKRLVVDWYYKLRNGGQTQLHLCKFVGDKVLFSSENNGEPWYTDGQYPFVLDVLFPMEGSPAGFGFIDTGKHAQEQIDLINQAIITNALANCRPRYFQVGDSGVNEAEFGDWAKQIVHVDGTLNDNMIRPITNAGLDSVYVTVLQNKISELKETTSNQDVQTGTARGGITAASAIQALQETAGMPMKDATRGSYRAYEEVVRMVIERIRQFYDAPRTFRITGDNGQMEFRSFDNAAIQPYAQGIGMDGEQGYRLPEFDIEVVAQGESAYTKLKNNEDIINLFQMGVFNPENVDVSLMLLDMLDMPRKDKLVSKLQEYKTVYDKMAQYAQLAVALAQKYDPQLAAGLMQTAQMDLASASAKRGVAAQADKTAAQEELETQNSAETQTRARASNTTKPGE